MEKVIRIITYDFFFFFYCFNLFQAPETMKTVSISMWYFSVALGNLIVIFINKMIVFEKKVIYSNFYVLKF